MQLASAIALVLAFGPAAEAATNDAPKGASERRAVVFYTADTHGTLEPCGCTSDPLGDFARVTALVRAAASTSKNVVLVDAGNLFFPSGSMTAGARAAAELRAEFIAREMARLPFAGTSLDESDFAIGSLWGKGVARLAANVRSSRLLKRSPIVRTGGIAIGVLGVADPETVRAAHMAADDPAEVARKEVARLRASGAEIVVLLAPLDRPAARNLARVSGADFVVLGRGVGGGMSRAERVGDAYLVAPAEELQRIGRLEIVLSGPRAAGEPLVDAGSADQLRQRAAELDQTIARREGELARWRKTKDADPTFVAAKTRELDQMRGEREQLARPWQPPQAAAYFTNTLVPIRRSLPRDPELAKSMRTLDEKVGRVNLAHAEPPAAAEPGRAYYVGGETCASCHEDAAKAWAKTRHAHAWQTLVDVGKQAHPECVVCHVTGYGEVGGSSLGHTAKLENVQCEACHQANSIHVARQGEAPYAGLVRPPESLCARCHTEKHSDTFQYEPYLREVLGPGHGQEFLRRLGPGPTATDLRNQARARVQSEGP